MLEVMSSAYLNHACNVRVVSGVKMNSVSLRTSTERSKDIEVAAYLTLLLHSLQNLGLRTDNDPMNLEEFVSADYVEIGVMSVLVRACIWLARYNQISQPKDLGSSFAGSWMMT